MVGLGARLRAVEGYPPESADYYDTPRLAGWVAVLDGELVGHVALHERSADPVMELAERVTELPLERIGVLARLFVAIECRRHGLARRLIDITVGESHRLDRRPILDVNILFEPAIALYESCGWERVGEVEFRYRDTGRLLEIRSHVYVGPAVPPGPGPN
ncbi:MAG: GNAT family N-acetyltransferase [Actinobacteria bacterium]|nr:GNAT family N-acetyltransferase [Actinomycetota bacterium]